MELTRVVESGPDGAAGRALFVREPVTAEGDRVGYLFRGIPVRRDARVLMAVRRRPIERFVAAAAWWPEAEAASFQIICQPGVARAEAFAALLPGLRAAAEGAGLGLLQDDALWTRDDEWFAVLQSHGFETLRTEISFEVAYADAWTRVTRLHQKYQKEIPSSWRTDPIRLHPPESILELVALHCLMPPAEICRRWRLPCPSGLDPELSCILFDGRRPFGAFLLRRIRDVLYIEVQVVREPNSRRRSLADLCLLHHAAQRVAPGGAVQRIQFRSGEAEHRQTGNLARRMGGRETGRRHLLGLRLKST